MMLRSTFMFAVVLGIGVAEAGRAQGCPHVPAVTLTSPEVPADVCIPADLAGASAEDQLPYFDDYSWRTFLAMVWPARIGMRGMPDHAQKPTGGGPVVFQTMKGLWELLQGSGGAPTCCTAPAADWSHYEDKSANACEVAPAFGDLVMASFSKVSDLGEVGFGKLTGALEAQNRTYIRYTIGYNRVEFEQIRNQKLYQRDSLGDVTFQDGSLNVKSAWMEMKDIADPGRYYTTSAVVRDPDAAGTCSLKKMGLVGFHIAQKTPSRPQWIWSSFEQIDNAPPAPPGAQKPYAFYKDGAGPMTSLIPIDAAFSVAWPPAQDRKNVERSSSYPIHAKTQATNLAYRAALQQLGSVWQYYQLVLTQFPVKPAGQDDAMFPDLAQSSSAIGNLAMETFNQDVHSAVSCIGCHKSVKDTSDFVWSLADRTKRTGYIPR